jgi:RNA polymerase sigma-70 factor (ECF subfamily)
MEELKDKELVERAQRGDRAAFGEFVRRHQRRIYRLVFQMLRDGAEAEDATQECFVRAFAALDRFDGRSEPFTWVYRIAVNLSLNALRARKPRGRSAQLDDPKLEALLVEARPALGDPVASALTRELSQALLEGLDSLSESLRTTVILVAVEGLSHQAAGEILGCPEGTVAWRVHEGRRQLRQFLQSKGHARTGTSGD